MGLLVPAEPLAIRRPALTQLFPFDIWKGCSCLLLMSKGCLTSSQITVSLASADKLLCGPCSTVVVKAT